jgi:hypothetical protein
MPPPAFPAAVPAAHGRARSTMTIGAPQQGHRRALSLKCSSAPASQVMTGTAMSWDSGAASSSRARANFAIRVVLASRP